MAAWLGSYVRWAGVGEFLLSIREGEEKLTLECSGGKAVVPGAVVAAPEAAGNLPSFNGSEVPRSELVAEFMAFAEGIPAVGGLALDKDGRPDLCAKGAEECFAVRGAKLFPHPELPYFTNGEKFLAEENVLGEFSLHGLHGLHSSRS